MPRRLGEYMKKHLALATVLAALASSSPAWAANETCQWAGKLYSAGATVCAGPYSLFECLADAQGGGRWRRLFDSNYSASPDTANLRPPYTVEGICKNAPYVN